MRTPSRRSVGLTTTLLGVATIGVSLLSSPASADHEVVPQAVNDTENLKCAELAVGDPEAEPPRPPFSGGQTWLEEKFESPSDGPDLVQNGITVDMNGETSFDWSSTFGIDAVFVKGGQGSQIYVYAPDATHEEAVADEGLSLATDQDISHISFCYDTTNPPPPDTTTTSTTVVETTTTTAAPTITTAGVGGVSIVRDPATTTTAAQVLGVQLARTGPSDYAPLGYFGLALVGTGLVLVGQHRRSRAF